MGYGIGGRLVSNIGGKWDRWEVGLKNRWDMGLVGGWSQKWVGNGIGGRRIINTDGTKVDTSVTHL